MSKIQYTYFPLDGATTVLRKHPREVTPPGMTEINNAIPARSDSSVTIRPNWVYVQDPILGISSDIVAPETSTLRDVLNSASGIYGSEQVTFFTSYIPYGVDNGVLDILSDTHDSGSCNLTVGSSTVLGTNTEFLELAYRGALVRFKNRGTTYTGSPCLWTDSGGTAGEWYLTDASDAEIPLLGQKILSIQSQNYRYGTVGSLVDGQAGTGDNDTLSFTTIYAATAGGVNPNTISSGRFMRLEMATNISGTPYKWTNTADGGATDEYYLTLKAGTVPPFVPDAWMGGADTPEYLRQTLSYYNRSHARFWDRENRSFTQVPFVATSYDQIDHGEVGSLADYEWGIGDSTSDSLGFNTIYVASPSGDPDTSLGVSGFSSIDPSPVWENRSSKTQSLGVAYYEDVSHGTGNWTWVKSNVSGTHGGQTHFAYYLKLSAGDPGIDRPLDFVIDGARPGWWVVTPDGLGSFHQSREYYSYGDSALDNLGYNTIYWFPSGDSGRVASGNTVEITGYHRYVCSNYTWTASLDGTNEYYLEQQDGSELAAAFDDPYRLYVGGQTAPKGTVSSLLDGEWGYGKGASDSRTFNTIYYRDDSGDPDTIETTIYASYQFDLYTSKYKWTEGGTSNEWYVTLLDGTDPSISEPTYLTVDGYEYTNGTLDSLAVNEWDYGDTDSLGFETLYIYATSTPDGSVGAGQLDETLPSTVYIRNAAADYDYFLVDNIVSDTELSIVGTPTTADTAAQPTFFYNHNPFRSTYKLNIQGYSEGLIYCSPFTGPGVNPQDISGPFYGGLEQGDWAYDSEIVVDSSYVGTGNSYAEQPTLAKNTFSFVQINPWFGDSPGDDFDGALEKAWVSTANGVGKAGAWTRRQTYYIGPDFTDYLEINGDAPSEDAIIFNSIQASGSTFISGCTNLSAGEPAIGYSTDSYGLEWQIKRDDSYPWADTEVYATTDYIGLCAAWNGGSPGRMVGLYHRVSDDRVVVRYTDDSGANFSDTNIGGNTYITDGDTSTKVYYIGNQFILVVKDGIYYGDGTSFTKQAITGADAINDVVYNGQGTWAAIESDGIIWSTSSITGTWESVTLPRTSTGETNWITYDTIGERYVIVSQVEIFWSDDLETFGFEIIKTADPPGGVQDPTNIVQDAGYLLSGIYGGGESNFRHLKLSRYSYFWWDITKFIPISNNYRSTTFSVISGYTILIGVSEREFENTPTPATETISTSPAIDGTVKDFTFTLASTGDLGIDFDSIVIKATLTSDSTETITDDGAGTLKGNVSATGTISYDTGECRLIFNDVTVKNATTMTASYNYLVEGSTTGWGYYPRRVRWSVPQTYNDFEGVGSGTADVNGEGAFLDARTVNGRVVIFESNAISTIVPRGDVTDPWDYEQIKANVRNLSNPVVVDDRCYFIASDGLLWQTDSINVTETGSSFDITVFDDFTEDRPVILDYSSALNSLLVYYFDINQASPKCYAVSLSNGSVTSIDLPLISDSDGLSELPAGLCAIGNSSDQRIFASHHPTSADDDQIAVSSLFLGGRVTGKDELATTGQDDYWYSKIKTGELFILPEGRKTSLRHLIARTYTESPNDNTNRPSMAIETRSIEDSSWSAVGDSVGTASMTTSALTGSGTAWSTLIAGPDAGATQQKCTGAETDFTSAWQADQVRWYLDSTLQVSGTDYTTSGSTVSFTVAPAADKTLYGYCENYPEVKVAVGDAFKSSEGFHRITAINSAQDVDVDHYLSTGSETVTHYSLAQLPDGEGETKLGVSGLVEGVRFGIFIIPKYGADTTRQEDGVTVVSEAPSIVKITGITIGHVPQGRKIVKATGS